MTFALSGQIFVIVKELQKRMIHPLGYIFSLAGYIMLMLFRIEEKKQQRAT